MKPASEKRTKVPKEVALELLEGSKGRVQCAWALISQAELDLDTAVDLLETNEFPRDFLTDDAA